MKNMNIFKLVAFTLLIGLFASCSSDKVMTGGLLQKRKYNKGFYFEGFAKKEKEANKINHKNENQTESNSTATSENVVDQSISASTNKNEINLVAPSLSELVAEKQAKTNTTKISTKEAKNRAKMEKKAHRLITKIEKRANSTAGDDIILYYILAILIPFVAVGLVTDWEIKQVLICLILTMLCYIPGLIYALMKVSQNS